MMGRSSGVNARATAQLRASAHAPTGGTRARGLETRAKLSSSIS